MKIPVKNIRLLYAVGYAFVSAMVLFSAQVSCAQESLPADVTLNSEAGRGWWMIIKVRVNDRMDIPCVVDTGSPVTLLDKSVVPLLGKQNGKAEFDHFAEQIKSVSYPAPVLSLSGASLALGKNIYVSDFGTIATVAHKSIKGIIGMDCLAHYRLQIDFKSEKLRFLRASQVVGSKLGSAYPLTLSSKGQPEPWMVRPIFRHTGLLGGNDRIALIDTGYDTDGRVDFKPAGTRTGRVHWPGCHWDGRTYRNLDVDIARDGNLIGLRFLARHLVTFDFPGRVMYLKQTDEGPLGISSDLAAASNYFRKLFQAGKLPGISKQNKITFELESDSVPGVFDFKIGKGSLTNYYRCARGGSRVGWHIEQAWQTDQSNRVVRWF